MNFQLHMKRHHVESLRLILFPNQRDIMKYCVKDLIWFDVLLTHKVVTSKQTKCLLAH
jgi:hypothetical protein